jgi:hypothetical protein
MSISTVVIQGCGDSAKSTVQLLLRQGPCEAYERWPMQSGLPKRIIMIAEALGELGTKQTFKAGTRGLYNGLSRFFPEESGDPSLILPIAGRVMDNDTGTIYYTDNGGKTIKNLNQKLGYAPDVIIPATGLSDPNAGNPAISEIRNSSYGTDRFGTPVGPRTDNPYLNIQGATIGPIGVVNARTNSGVPENSAAIALYAPAATLPGYKAGLTVNIQMRDRKRQQGYYSP